MSKVPYYFDTPIPKYFRENGWYSNPNTILFLIWAFSKCSIEARTVVHDSKIINLQAFEFITGRGKSSNDCLLTEDAFKHQLKIMSKAGFLKKTPNSAPNRYTCYVWVTECFSSSNTQLNTRPSANSAPTERPQSRIKNKRNKESHHPDPSSFLPIKSEGLTDDFFLNKNIEHNMKSQTLPQKTDHISNQPKQELALIEVYPKIWLTQEVLDKCIEVKGTLEETKFAIKFIQESPKRKREIDNWPKTLESWKIKVDPKKLITEHEKLAADYVKKYDNFGAEYYPSISYDKNKDQKGLWIIPKNPYLDSIFFAFGDNQFKEKVNTFIKDKALKWDMIKIS